MKKADMEKAREIAGRYNTAAIGAEELLAQDIATALAAEREACAEIADEEARASGVIRDTAGEILAQDIAAAIRARGDSQ